MAKCLNTQPLLPNTSTPDSTQMSREEREREREERVKALLQQRRQTFGLAQPAAGAAAQQQRSDATAHEDASAPKPASSSKHDRIQELLALRRKAQQGACGVCLHV